MGDDASCTVKKIWHCLNMLEMFEKVVKIWGDLTEVHCSRAKSENQSG